VFVRQLFSQPGGRLPGRGNMFGPCDDFYPISAEGTCYAVASATVGAARNALQTLESFIRGSDDETGSQRPWGYPYRCGAGPEQF
jgi:hypothetical protein